MAPGAGDRLCASAATWTYAEIGERVRQAARGLQDIGVKPGMRVGLCLPNTPYFVIFYFAILRVGGVVVNFNPLYTERELRHQIRRSRGIDDDGRARSAQLIHAKVAADRRGGRADQHHRLPDRRIWSCCIGARGIGFRLLQAQGDRAYPGRRCAAT